MNLPRNIADINSCRLKSYSNDDLPVITPCSNIKFNTNLQENLFLSLFSSELPTIKVYSENDGTFITFPTEAKTTVVEDLRNYIYSLKEFNKNNHYNFDSKASTMDSSFNSSIFSNLTNTLSIDCYDVDIYGVIPGNKRKVFKNDSNIFEILEKNPELRFYYSIRNCNLKNIDEDELIVTVFPKANITEIGIDFTLNITADKLKFTLKDQKYTGKKIIIINFSDVISITKYKNAENCLFIKRKNITKDPILIRTRNKYCFERLLSKIKNISEIRIDSHIISEADRIISTINEKLYSIKEIIKFDKKNYLINSEENNLINEFLFSSDKYLNNTNETKFDIEEDDPILSELA
ncbi:hypothetical protein FG386_001103 [Cryptosporidium ryanae]|uniref:uncharacterized protein n=1 Tax=Cryptosporidium ryanae TaxID=515981 RepID=UPI00351A0997|nr:hypothetical protein FG386_001103 [Cryptosporidium ryanae]